MDVAQGALHVVVHHPLLVVREGLSRGQRPAAFVPQADLADPLDRVLPVEQDLHDVVAARVGRQRGWRPPPAGIGAGVPRARPLTDRDRLRAIWLHPRPKVRAVVMLAGKTAKVYCNVRNDRCTKDLLLQLQLVEVVDYDLLEDLFRYAVRLYEDLEGAEYQEAGRIWPKRRPFCTALPQRSSLMSARGMTGVQDSVEEHIDRSG